MMLTPTLHFHGSCEEAIGLYTRAFGCSLRTLLHDPDSGPDSSLGKPRILHSEVDFGGQTVRMSDGLREAQPPVRAMFLTLSMDTASQVRQAFEILVEAGGVVVEPLEATPFSACMGSVLDPYGFRWRMMVEGTGN